jgi:hypothetical protein
MMKFRIKTLSTDAIKKTPNLKKMNTEVSPSKPWIKADKKTKMTSIDRTRKFIGLV